MKNFTITGDHLKLVRQMNVGYHDCCEFGAPEIDPKRPYGNGDVYSDIGEILGIKREFPGRDEAGEFSEEQEKKMLKAHKETAVVLQIILATGTFQVGAYQADDYSRNWTFV